MMKFKRVKKMVSGAGLCLVFSLAILISSLLVTEAEASTGVVENAYSQTSPYGFTWTNTNSAPLDATASTQGMFEFNYSFTSGSDWRMDLGRPTTYDGTVDINVFTANVRSDKNTALYPPKYGIFSGEFMTGATNPFFSQPVNKNYWYANSDENPNGLQAFDTLQQGVNNRQPVLGQESKISVNPSGAGGFLQPTSIGEYAEFAVEK
jgi:hypothetical protein